MKTCLATGAAFAAGPLTGSAAAQDTCTGGIVITEMNRASAAVVTGVASFPTERAYGCDVRKNPSPTTPALASRSETCKPDILTEVWINRAPSYDELSENETIVALGDVLAPSSPEGWYNPTYLAEEHPDLLMVEGLLANPDLVGGRFDQRSEGWVCRSTNASFTRAPDFEGQGFEGFEHDPGETIATSIPSGVANREPILSCYWGNTSVPGKYGMRKIDLGPDDETAFLCHADPDYGDVGRTSFPVAPVKTVGTRDFEERHPDIARLLANVTFTVDQRNDVLTWQADKNASGEETTVYILTNSSDVWRDRVAHAARERLSAFVP